jgi:hemoglobin
MTETLFLKYGGTSLLNTVVENFYSKVVQHPSLQHYFAGHDIEKLKNHQATFLAVLMGAPPALYTGRGMKEAHHHLHVTEEAFDLVAVTLGESLRQGGMEETDVAVRLEALGKFRGDVVRKEG